MCVWGGSGGLWREGLVLGVELLWVGERERGEENVNRREKESVCVKKRHIDTTHTDADEHGRKPNGKGHALNHAVKMTSLSVVGAKW